MGVEGVTGTAGSCLTNNGETIGAAGGTKATGLASASGATDTDFVASVGLLGEVAVEPNKAELASLSLTWDEGDAIVDAGSIVFVSRCSSKSNNLESLLVMIVELDAVDEPALLEAASLLLLVVLVDVATAVLSLFFCCLFIISSSILIRSSSERLSRLALSKLAAGSMSAIVSAIGFAVTASSNTFSSPYSSSSSSLWPVSALKLSLMLRISTGSLWVGVGAMESPFLSLLADEEPLVLGALFFSSLSLARLAKRGVASQTS